MQVCAPGMGACSLGHVNSPPFPHQAPGIGGRAYHRYVGALYNTTRVVASTCWCCLALGHSKLIFSFWSYLSFLHDKERVGDEDHRTPSLIFCNIMPFVLIG